MKKALCTMLISVMLVSMLATFAPASAQTQTVVKVIPALIEKGPENVIGQQVVIAVVVENVENLYGFDIKFKWNTTFLDYVSRKVTVPVESYPDPQPPSPYGGVLHTGPSGDPITVKDTLDPIAGTYHLAKASLAPAPAFSGNGTFFTMTFVIKYQQWDYQGDAIFFFDFIDVKLTNSTAKLIPHVRQKGTFIMHGTPFPQPEKPTLKIVPESYQYKGELPKIVHLNLNIVDLHPYWDLAGFDVKIVYDPRFIKVTNVTAGPFLEQYNITFRVKEVINNTEGYIRLAYCQVLPPDQRPTPEGTGVLFTIEVNATVPISETTFEIESSTLASFPHPERPEPPWSNKPWSVPIPHYTGSCALTIIHRKVHVITVNSFQAEIITESNSTISPINYQYLISDKEISFNATGLSGFAGYCNVTIPKQLMWGTWMVMVDNQPVTPIITEDGANTYLYFTYDFQSIRQITIASSEVIPEFPSMITLLTILALELAVSIVFLKRSKKKL
ncbi:MAG: hypothetical protein QW791_02655 [Candidatus Bathyarchaeia archaeon]